MIAAERPAGWLNRAAFFVFWLVFGTALRLFFRVRVRGRPRLDGGYVLAANHTSFLDPLLLGAASFRRVTFLMTELVFRGALLGWFYRFTRAIPLAARGGNRDALRAARAALDRGEVLGIFPEGGISRDGKPMRALPGAVSLALAGGVAIVPVAIVGADGALPPGAILPRPKRVTIVFGQPFRSEDIEGARDRRSRVQAASREIMARIAALRDPETRETSQVGPTTDR